MTDGERQHELIVALWDAARADEAVVFADVARELINHIHEMVRKRFPGHLDPIPGSAAAEAMKKRDELMKRTK